jgi:catechol 2,3-dioxygenase-like lactoylglutathione lyase family enzyme
MRVVPVRYARDVAATVRFYQALGLDLGAASRPGIWVELPAAGGMVAVHQADGEDVGRCELAFESEEPLDKVAARMRAAGFEVGPVIDENHGQSLRVCDPDGVWVQISLLDRELYT